MADPHKTNKHPMYWHCPTCGGESEKIYRCTECGADLADKGKTNANEKL